ncbi:hypothetical protein HYR54_05990 [Candidatus Acetothermia bacterium]|nr:hypothetical protein [Candidatus Acetothermia bacterium]
MNAKRSCIVFASLAVLVLGLALIAVPAQAISIPINCGSSFFAYVGFHSIMCVNPITGFSGLLDKNPSLSCVGYGANQKQNGQIFIDKADCLSFSIITGPLIVTGGPTGITLSAFAWPCRLIANVLKRNNQFLDKSKLIPIFNSPGCTLNLSSRLTVVPAAERSSQSKPLEAMTAQVYNLRGRLVYESNTAASPSLIETALKSVSQQLAPGVYLAVVSTRGNQGELIRREVRKLVVTR